MIMQEFFFFFILFKMKRILIKRQLFFELVFESTLINFEKKKFSNDNIIIDNFNVSKIKRNNK